MEISWRLIKQGGLNSFLRRSRKALVCLWVPPSPTPDFSWYWAMLFKQTNHAILWSASLRSSRRCMLWGQEAGTYCRDVSSCDMPVFAKTVYCMKIGWSAFVRHGAGTKWPHFHCPILQFFSTTTHFIPRISNCIKYFFFLNNCS